MAGLIERQAQVLIVDDDEISRKLLARMINKTGMKAITVSGGKEALLQIEMELPDLILSDITMPGMDGFELCHVLKGNVLTKRIPLIFISAMTAKEEKLRGLQLGAVDFITKPYALEEVTIRVTTHVKMYQMQIELETYNQKLTKMLTEQVQQIESIEKKTMFALAKVTEGNKGISEGNHLKNVGHDARILAQSLAFSPIYENKITPSFIEMIEIAAMIHDVGKIFMPDAILLKPGPLTKEERAIVRTHCKEGVKLLDEIFSDMKNAEFVQIARDIVFYHHENWNGSGYPKGLKGEEIPLAARIVSIVDVYDTLRGERVYKPAYTRETSLKKMEIENAGDFDPEIYDIFLKVEKQFRKG